VKVTAANAIMTLRTMVFLRSREAAPVAAVVAIAMNLFEACFVCSLERGPRRGQS
jgi:hypothetical protein